MSGGGIMGITMGRLPCSLLLDMEVDAVLEDSEMPFLATGRDTELLTWSGEPSQRSVEGGIFGNKFSGRGEKKDQMNDDRSKKKSRFFWLHSFFLYPGSDQCVMLKKEVKNRIYCSS